MIAAAAVFRSSELEPVNEATKNSFIHFDDLNFSFSSRFGNSPNMIKRGRKPDILETIQIPNVN